MSNQDYLFAEELMRQAASSPRPSRDLRVRIVAAAGRAARRRLWIRRSALAVGIAFALAGATFWKGGPSGSRVASAQAQPARRISAFACPSDLMAMCKVGEWAHVECVVRLREMQLHILRGTY
jgi:hypothetical protein